MNKNVVYFIKFDSRIENNTTPYYYIGSKSNCKIENGLIYDKNGKPYYGSSTYQNYKQIVHESKISVKVIKEFETFEECLRYENRLHLKLDVSNDERFFNKAVATYSYFNNPNYGTYRNVETNEFLRLPKSHTLVTSGQYVNANKGYKTYNNGVIEKQFLNQPDENVWKIGRLENNKRYGIKNGFYNKTHDEKTKKKIIETRENFYNENPEIYDSIRNTLSKNCSERFKGGKQSKEHVEKRVRKGHLVLMNIKTGEYKSVPVNEVQYYDNSLWKSVLELNKFNASGMIWITNGIIEKYHNKDEAIPESFKHGRLPRGKK